MSEEITIKAIAIELGLHSGEHDLHQSPAGEICMVCGGIDPLDACQGIDYENDEMALMTMLDITTRNNWAIALFGNIYSFWMLGRDGSPVNYLRGPSRVDVMRQALLKIIQAMSVEMEAEENGEKSQASEKEEARLIR